MTKRKPGRDSIRAISKRSYAKINLYLEILGKRPDNYHQIRSIFSEIDLYDEMNFALLEREEIKVNSSIAIGKLEDNTVYRVAKLMQDRFDIDKGIEIEIIKRIPLGAGLGGGSSNAATAIKALSRLWSLNMKNEDMESLAAETGSDINFFLYGGTALGEGRGEIVKVIDPIDLDMILLVKPKYGISSSDAYRWLTEYGNNDNWEKLIETKDPACCFNRLESTIRTKFPEIDGLIRHLKSNGARQAILSGSGSTVIGFYDDRQIFDDHFNYYKEKGFWCYQTKTKRS